MPGGHSAHSSFKLPFNCCLKNTNICSNSKGTGTAQVLQKCQCIVWDECTPCPIRRPLKMSTKPRKTSMATVGVSSWCFACHSKRYRVDELKASVKSSYLWRNVKKLPLSTNMRVHRLEDQYSGAFVNKLLILGNGNVPSNSEGSISPLLRLSHLKMSYRPKSIPILFKHYKNLQLLCEHAILACKIMIINSLRVQLLQQQLPGNSYKYRLIDTVVEHN